MIFVHDTPTNRLLNMVLGGGSPVVEYTATGNPLIFQTDISRPLKSLLIPFSPRQEGSGDPSPENIRSIVPRNGLTVFGGGKNLFDKNATPYQEGKYINDNSVVGGQLRYTENQNYNVYKIPVAKNAKYVIGLVKATQPGVALVDGQGTVTYFATNQGGTEGTYKYISTGSKDEFLLVSVAVNGTYKCDDVLQIEVGQTATAYESYKPITETDIVFPSPVYGGEHEAVSGRLENGWWSLDVAWSDRWYGQQLTNVERRVFRLPTGIIPKTEAYYNDHKEEILCNTAKWGWSFTDDSVHFYVAKDGANYVAIVFLPIGTPEDTMIQIVGTLATPQEQTLTGHQITALVGDNTIWSDADGSMTAVYLKKG